MVERCIGWDVVEGDGSTRSRLVARDSKVSDLHRDDLFAASPPLEAARAVLSMAATDCRDESQDDRRQESTLESALQGGRLHQVANGSGSTAG